MPTGWPTRCTQQQSPSVSSVFYVTIVRNSMFIVELRWMLRHWGQEGGGNVLVCKRKWVYLKALERRYYFFSLVFVKFQVHQSRWKTAEWTVYSLLYLPTFVKEITVDCWYWIRNYVTNRNLIWRRSRNHERRSQIRDFENIIRNLDVTIPPTDAAYWQLNIANR